MPARRKEVDVDSVKTVEQQIKQVSVLFSNSQHSIATHRKNIVQLHSVFEKCAAFIQPDDKHRLHLTGERLFKQRFKECLVYPLGIKKGVEQADRVVKFIAGFVAYAVDHELKSKQGQDQADEDDDDEDDDEGPATRLCSSTFSFLLKGFQAKNKIARYRCSQLVALLVRTVPALDDETFTKLRASLLDLVNDKESIVRMQAVVALAALQDADADLDDEDEDSDEAPLRVTDVLLDVLCHDRSAEVRRAALFNIPPSMTSLEGLLSRTRDIDTINRKGSYSHVLIEIPPASFTLKQRTALMEGLKDREEGVVKAARKLCAAWADKAGGLEQLLSLFDLYQGDTAETVANAVYAMKPRLAEDLDFSDASFMSLTPVRALILRTYLSHLRALSDSRLADLEPVATALSYYIHNEWTKLTVQLDSIEFDEAAENAHAFIIQQLCLLAREQDEGDEIGRRKMFDCMREMLTSPALPATLIPFALDVLHKDTPERDFMRIVVEIVQQIRIESSLVTSESDGFASDSTQVTMGTAKKRRIKARREMPDRAEKRKDLDMRCLAVVKCLLERVTGALQENSVLHGLVAEVIVPAVKTKDSQIRAQGLICLGLCCLLDKSMALDSFQLLARQSQSTDGDLQIKILQTLFDVFVLYGISFGLERDFGPDVILGFLQSSLEQDEAQLLATSAVGISKLMLSGTVTDEDVLHRLLLLYFASETADNEELRQCLSYFFPVYAYTSAANQRRLSDVLIDTLLTLKSVYEEAKSSSAAVAMVPPAQIGLQLVDWTDPSKAISSDRFKVDELIHFDLAERLVERVFGTDQKDERKLFVGLLSKLFVPEDERALPIERLKLLLLKVEAIGERRPLADAVSKNALGRFEKSLLKAFKDRIDEFETSDDFETKRKEVDVKFKAWLKQSLTDDEGEEEEEEEAGSSSQEDDDAQTASEGVASEAETIADDKPARRAAPAKAASKVQHGRAAACSSETDSEESDGF